MPVHRDWLYINTEFGRPLVKVNVGPGPFRLLSPPWVACLRLKDGYNFFLFFNWDILSLYF